MKNTDKKFMQLAIALAKKGDGKVSRNPMVGCVIVKNNKIISTGYHKYFGGAHAEIDALVNCKSPSGSTMYVNLEPCCHYNKKTPPCVPEIINSGIKKVVIAMKDPNPAVSGKGIRQLRQNNVKCEIGLLRDEAEKLNEKYIKYVKTGMPFVILKMAYSLDGKTKTETSDSKWLSSIKSRKIVHQLRSEVDAVAVGINTVLKDNPELTSHGQGRNPIRIVLDCKLKIPITSNVLNTESRTIVATTENSSRTKKEKLEKIGVEIIELPSKNNFLNIKKLLLELGKIGVSSLLVEGGETVARSFLTEKLVDKIMFFFCPIIVCGYSKIKKAIKLKNVSLTKVDGDFLFESLI